MLKLIKFDNIKQFKQTNENKTNFSFLSRRDYRPAFI